MSVGKLAGIAGTALRSNLSMLGRPYKLTFSITYWCQSRCLTCNIWEIKPKGELSLQEIQEFAKKNNYFKWIEITGGEPFMRNDIVDVVKAFHESSKGLYILTMPTNSLCNEEMVVKKLEQILALGIPKVSVTLSLDGYRELHDKIRGVPGNFDRVMRMATRLRELQKRYGNLFFIFGYTMSKFNQGQLERTIDEVRKIHPWARHNNFHVNAGQVSDIYYSNTNLGDIKAAREEMSREVEGLIKGRGIDFGQISFIETAFLRNLVKYIKTGEPPMKSRSLDASLFMDSYGNVYPSIMWGRKIGNVRDTGYDLSDLWHNGEAEEVRGLIRAGKEPKSWTACEAYQTITGNIISLLV